MVRYSVIAAVLFCLLLSPMVIGKEADDSLIIDTLYISRMVVQEGGVIGKRLAADPSISVNAIPMPGSYALTFMDLDPNVMNRQMRIYMPRSYEEFLNEHDSVILFEAMCGLLRFPEVQFNPEWISWMVKAVQEEGMPLSMWNGKACWCGEKGVYKSWEETMLQEILPFECFGQESSTKQARPQFVNPNHPLAVLPWKNWFLMEMWDVKPKLGTIQVARGIEGDQSYPWIAWWRTGEGKVLGEAAKRYVGRSWADWRWYDDFLVYLAYFAADKPIPSNIHLVHRLREEITTYLTNAALLTSVLDFAEKFGANTIKIYEQLDEIDTREKVAEEHYRRNQYEQANQVLEEVQTRLNELDSRAVDLKKKALLWVYIIEWLVITGTALISGIFLWMLMLKRRMYKEIEVTRAA